MVLEKQPKMRRRLSSFRRALRSRRPSLTPAMRHGMPDQAMSFHFFPYLPTELRLLIWEAAIRRLDEAGAHYFTLFSGCPGPSRKHQDACMCKSVPGDLVPPAGRLAPSSPNMPLCTGVGAPKLAKGETDYSWTRDNPSAYLADYGLWHACVESSRVMRKHVRKMRNSPARVPPLSEPFWRSDEVRRARTMAPGPKVFQFHDKDEQGWLTITPKQDLFILRPSSWIKMGRDSSRTWTELMSVPLMAPQSGGVTHIGFEWDESYMTRAPSTNMEWLGRSMVMMDAAQAVSFLGRCNFYVWIIDNYLELTREAVFALVARNPKRQVFHATDRIFVELFEEDEGACLPPRCDGKSSRCKDDDVRLVFAEQREMQRMCMYPDGDAATEDWEALSVDEQDQRLTAALSIRIAGWAWTG